MIQLPDPTSYTMTQLPDHVSYGHFVSIAGDVKIISGGTHLAELNHKSVFTTNYGQNSDPEPITIGHDTWIGDGARIKNGVNIGKGCIIGQGAVITKDVPDYAVVVGNPQRIVRIRFNSEQIAALERIGWWHWSKEEVLERLDDMSDIDLFIKKYDKSSN